jgi:very-short-patch-repair endonuclease
MQSLGPEVRARARLPCWGRDRVGGRAAPQRLSAIAPTLRREATNAERRLWQRLRRKQVAGFRFRRQVVLGDFFAEFASFDARLVVEVDGATHSVDEEIAYDAARSAALATQRFTILRFTNEDVYRNLDGMLETIWTRLTELRPRIEGCATELRATPHPDPPPQGGRERARPPSGERLR